MRRIPVLALIGCVFLAGCGGSDVVSVSGTLTYKGQPVTNAYIHFVPEKGRPSMGETDQNGRFTLVYDPQTKGAQLGKHRVWVQYNTVADAGRPGVVPGQAPKLSSDMREFFNKYGGDNSKVEVVIDKATSDLQLKWD
jgi:hypothetical protein